MDRCIAVVLIAVALASPAAHAGEPPCEPLDATTFGSLVFDAQAATDQRDPDLHRSIVLELQGRLSCLTFAPTPRQLANYLGLEALMEYVRGGDWQAPVTAARRLWPTVDLGVGDWHEIARFEPEAEPPGLATPVPPECGTLYVDGEGATEVPSRGIHVVQHTDGERWRTVVMRSDPVDLVAVCARFPKRRTWRWAGHLDVAVGVGGGLQRRVSWPEVEREPQTWTADWPEPEPGEYVIPNRDWVVAWPAVTARGMAVRGRLAAVAQIEVGLPALTRAHGTGAEGFVGYALPSDSVFGVGVGVGGGTIVELDTTGTEQRRTLQVAYGAATVQSWRDHNDLSVTVGLGGSTARLGVAVGALQQVRGANNPLRIGLSTSVIGTRFEQPPLGEDEPGGRAWSVIWRVGLEVGLSRRGG